MASSVQISFLPMMNTWAETFRNSSKRGEVERNSEGKFGVARGRSEKGFESLGRIEVPLLANRASPRPLIG